MSCGLTGPFVRFGLEEEVVAFLLIFVIPSMFAVGRWAEHRRDQSMLASKEPREKMQS